MAEQLRVQSVNRTVNVTAGNKLTVYSMGAINLGGGGGVTSHPALTNRNDADQHTIASITGLQGALDGKEATGVAAALVDDLSGVTDATTARSNLGLGTAAQSAATDFAAVTGDTFTGEVTFSGTNDRTARFVTSSPIVTANRHTVEIAYNGTTGTTNTALNVYSANPEMSAMWLRGTESGTGTLKITHDKPAVADTSAAALSIALDGANSNAKGIFVKPGDATYGGYQAQFQNAAGTERLRIDSTGQLMQISGNTYLGVAGVTQIGGTSVNGVTNGNGSLGLTNKTAPTGTVTNGISIYSESGVLKYRSGTNVITLDGAAGATTFVGLTDTNVTFAAGEDGKFAKYDHASGKIVLDAIPGGGDLLAANNLSELTATQSTARSNIGAAASATTVTAGAGLTGGGDLTANRTLDVVAAAGGGITVNADSIQVNRTTVDTWYDASGAASSAVSGHISGDPHAQYQLESEKGAASGYASLDGSTKVPIAQLPTGTTSSTVTIGDDTRFTTVPSTAPAGGAPTQVKLFVGNTTPTGGATGDIWIDTA